MAPTSTLTLVQIFVRSPEDDFTQFINGRFAIIGRLFSFIQLGRLVHPLTNFGLG